MKFFLRTFFHLCVVFAACTNAPENEEENVPNVNVYSQRHYDTDDSLFNMFTAKTGIKVNVLNAKADELINRIEMEGANSPADLLITVDVERMLRAKRKGLLQRIEDQNIINRVTEALIDEQGFWIAMSYRARLFVYNQEKVDTNMLSTYFDLSNEKWEGKILVRSSESGYNQALLSSIIANQGLAAGKEWAKGIVANMAREPKGNDRDQVKAMVAGVGDIAIINSYYLALMHNSDNEHEREVAAKASVFFPDQLREGTHINISAIGLTKSSKNKESAIRLIEFLLSDEAQSFLANNNYEYPSAKGVEQAPLVKSWGSFKADYKALPFLEEHHEDAIKIFHEVGWK